MRRAAGPVLATTRSLVSLPRLVIAAVDFSRASLQAARLAMRMVASDATVLLVNVQPDLGLISNSEGYCAVYAQGVKPALARLRRELDAPLGVTVESVILRGDPLGEILSLADRTGVDLIAAGTRRLPAGEHMALGGITTGLVRDGRFSLLIAPPLPCC
jgi:nucleotide-binding universal stress UspA family protein